MLRTGAGIADVATCRHISTPEVAAGRQWLLIIDDNGRVGASPFFGAGQASRSTVEEENVTARWGGCR
jgi:hypothetical protein